MTGQAIKAPPEEIDNNNIIIILMIISFLLILSPGKPSKHPPKKQMVSKYAKAGKGDRWSFSAFLFHLHLHPNDG